MNDLDEILIKISKFLKDKNVSDWSNTFENLYKEAIQYNVDYDVDFIIRVKSLFGGMGSFNDLVLSKNNKPLIEENNNLDNLKTELYEKCKELRLAKNPGKVIDL